MALETLGVGETFNYKPKFELMFHETRKSIKAVYERRIILADKAISNIMTILVKMDIISKAKIYYEVKSLLRVLREHEN